MASRVRLSNVVDVYVATKNAGKLGELRSIFSTFGWNIVVFPDYDDVTEGETSYATNAALKARSLFKQLRERGIRQAVIGDDSGLEVRALDDRPGVLSARYGGEGATWAERRASLLAEVSATGDDRTAAFVCALHFIDPYGKETSVVERLFGAIASDERGSAGFSYDPIFLFPPLGVTFAELSEERKNVISHRAIAARALLKALARTG